MKSLHSTRLKKRSRKKATSGKKVTSKRNALLSWRRQSEDEAYLYLESEPKEHHPTPTQPQDLAGNGEKFKKWWGALFRKASNFLRNFLNRQAENSSKSLTKITAENNHKPSTKITAGNNHKSSTITLESEKKSEKEIIITQEFNDPLRKRQFQERRRILAMRLQERRRILEMRQKFSERNTKELKISKGKPEAKLAIPREPVESTAQTDFTPPPGLESTAQTYSIPAMPPISKKPIRGILRKPKESFDKKVEDSSENAQPKQGADEKIKEIASTELIADKLPKRITFSNKVGIFIYKDTKYKDTKRKKVKLTDYLNYSFLSSGSSQISDPTRKLSDPTRKLIVNIKEQLVPSDLEIRKKLNNIKNKKRFKLITLRDLWIKEQTTQADAPRTLSSVSAEGLVPWRIVHLKNSIESLCEAIEKINKKLKKLKKKLKQLEPLLSKSKSLQDVDTTILSSPQDVDATVLSSPQDVDATILSSLQDVDAAISSMKEIYVDCLKHVFMDLNTIVIFDKATGPQSISRTAKYYEDKLKKTLLPSDLWKTIPFTTNTTFEESYFYDFYLNKFKGLNYMEDIRKSLNENNEDSEKKISLYGGRELVNSVIKYYDNEISNNTHNINDANHTNDIPIAQETSITNNKLTF